MTKQNPFDITTQEKQLDIELHKDEVSVMYRNQDFYKCRLIAELLEKLSYFTASQCKKRVRKEVVLGKMSYEPLTKEDTLIKIRRDFLRELENWSLNTSVEDLADYEDQIVDKKIGPHGSRVVIASFSFIPEKLEEVLKEYQSKLGCRTKSRIPVSQKVEVVGDLVCYLGNSLPLERGLNTMFKLLLNNKDKAVSLGKLMDCGYKPESIHQQLTKLRKRLKETFEPFGVEIKIKGTGKKAQVMTIKYPEEQ